MDEWVDDGTWDPDDVEFLAQKYKEAVDTIRKQFDKQNLKTKEDVDKEVKKKREQIAGMYPAA